MSARTVTALSMLLSRYADVVVHRVLAATLGLAPLPRSMLDTAGMKDMVDNLNVRHRNAQMAGRASVELHTLIFFRDRTALADARITKVSHLLRCDPLNGMPRLAWCAGQLLVLAFVAWLMAKVRGGVCCLKAVRSVGGEVLPLLLGCGCGGRSVR